MSTPSNRPVRVGYVLVIAAVVVAMTFATVLTINILNSRQLNHIENMHRVTLCIILTSPENRTFQVVEECKNNPPRLVELPGIARDELQNGRNSGD